MVLMKVSLWKCVIRFRKRGTLGPYYIGPFRVISRVGRVSYRLNLPEELSQIHNTFHVSQLWKCVVTDLTIVPLDDILVDDLLNYVEKQVVILDWKTKALHNKVVSLFNVQGQHRKGSEWTWETEAEMREH